MDQGSSFGNIIKGHWRIDVQEILLLLTISDLATKVCDYLIFQNEYLSIANPQDFLRIIHDAIEILSISRESR